MTTKMVILSCVAVLGFAHSANATLHSGRQVVAGFHSDDDDFDHAIVLDSAGNVREVYYVVNSFVSGGGALTTISNAMAIAGFYTEGDNIRHVIVGRTDGYVEEVYYGSWGVSTVTLGPSFGANTITGVAGWVDGNDYYHAAVSLTNGDVRDFAYGPHIGSPVWRTVANFGSGAVYDIAGWADNTNNRIVAQVASPTTEMAVIQWAGLNGNATVAWAGQANFPANCNMSASFNVTAFNGSPYVGQDYMAWGTTGDHVCNLDFSTPFSGTQTYTTYADSGFANYIRSVSGFAEIFSTTVVPHVVTALSNGDIYDVYGSNGSTSTYYLGRY